MAKPQVQYRVNITWPASQRGKLDHSYQKISGSRSAAVRIAVRHKSEGARVDGIDVWRSDDQGNWSFDYQATLDTNFNAGLTRESNKGRAAPPEAAS